MFTKEEATLVLEDGTFLTGQSFGAAADAVFELVFNTSMTGYQEILTDPSYRGQGVLFTASHIGNVGVNPEDYESAAPQVSAQANRVNLASGASERPQLSAPQEEPVPAEAPAAALSANPVMAAIQAMAQAQQKAMAESNASNTDTDKKPGNKS